MSKVLEILKHGIFLLVLGLVIGVLGGIGFAKAAMELSWGLTTDKFLYGFGLGTGGSVGLVAMIWVLKTCDRHLAAFDSKRSK